MLTQWLEIKAGGCCRHVFLVNKEPNGERKTAFNMLPSKARTLFGAQFRRWLNNSTYRCLTLSATSNTAQNVYKNENECLVVEWNDGNVDEFPYVYLRENCRCPACYMDERKSRTLYSPKEVDLDITAESANWNTENDQLEVNWGDGHNSHYSLKWLKYLRYVISLA